jgi:hypothetical protein
MHRAYTLLVLILLLPPNQGAYGYPHGQRLPALVANSVGVVVAKIVAMRSHAKPEHIEMDHWYATHTVLMDRVSVLAGEAPAKFLAEIHVAVNENANAKVGDILLVFVTRRALNAGAVANGVTGEPLSAGVERAVLIREIVYQGDEGTGREALKAIASIAAAVERNELTPIAGGFYTCPPEVVRAYESLLDSRNDDLRLWAVHEGLWGFDVNDASSVLIRGLTDSSPKVRNAAAYVLMYGHYDGDTGPLLQFAGAPETDPRERDSVMRFIFGRKIQRRFNELRADETAIIRESVAARGDASLTIESNTKVHRIVDPDGKMTTECLELLNNWLLSPPMRNWDWTYRLRIRVDEDRVLFYVD